MSFNNIPEDAQASMACAGCLSLIFSGFILAAAIKILFYM